MKFSESLKKYQQFQSVYKYGKSYANKYLVMYIMENGTGRNRIGISVSKKVGNSVVRHRVTRLVRESYRLHEAVFDTNTGGILWNRRSAAPPWEASSYHKGIMLSMKKILIAGIRFYQKYLSPMKRTKCPYIPTCSQYGLEAIEKHGAVKGSILALWRILRCNPFSKGGFDPVP